MVGVGGVAVNGGILVLVCRGGREVGGSEGIWEVALAAFVRGLVHAY